MNNSNSAPINSMNVQQSQQPNQVKEANTLINNNDENLNNGDTINHGYYFCNNRYSAIPQSARNYIVKDLDTGQMYQGLHLTDHYMKCFYNLAERVNCIQKYCDSLVEFITYRNMVIPEGTKVIRDSYGRPRNPLIFLLLPERGDSFHTTHTKMTLTENITVIQKIIKFMKLCHKVYLYFRDCKLQKFVQCSKQSSPTEIRLHNPFELFLSDSLFVKGRHRFTPFWAPEMFRQPEEYNGAKTDVWAFGVFIYRVFVGKYPFVDKDPQGFMTKVQQCQYSAFPDEVLEEAKTLVNMCLAINPEERKKVVELENWIDAKSNNFAANKQLKKKSGKNNI